MIRIQLTQYSRSSFKGSSAGITCEVAATVNIVRFSEMGELFGDMVSRKIYFTAHSTCSSMSFSTRMDCLSFSTIPNITKSFENCVLVVFYWPTSVFHFCSCEQCVIRQWNSLVSQRHVMQRIACTVVVQFKEKSGQVVEDKLYGQTNFHPSFLFWTRNLSVCLFVETCNLPLTNMFSSCRWTTITKLSFSVDELQWMNVRLVSHVFEKLLKWKPSNKTTFGSFPKHQESESE